MTPGFAPLTLPAAPVAAAGTGTRPIPGFRPLVVQAASVPAAPAAGVEPKVTIERDGDRVTCIIIQCPCGHTIELTCVYQPVAGGGG
jgi:hypothetical protein